MLKGKKPECFHILFHDSCCDLGFALLCDRRSDHVPVVTQAVLGEVDAPGYEALSEVFASTVAAVITLRQAFQSLSAKCLNSL